MLLSPCVRLHKKITFLKGHGRASPAPVNSPLFSVASASSPSTVMISLLFSAFHVPSSGLFPHPLRTYPAKVPSALSPAGIQNCPPAPAMEARASISIETPFASIFWRLVGSAGYLALPFPPPAQDAKLKGTRERKRQAQQFDRKILFHSNLLLTAMKYRFRPGQRIAL